MEIVRNYEIELRETFKRKNFGKPVGKVLLKLLAIVEPDQLPFKFLKPHNTPPFSFPPGRCRNRLQRKNHPANSGVLEKLYSERKRTLHQNRSNRCAAH